MRLRKKHAAGIIRLMAWAGIVLTLATACNLPVSGTGASRQSEITVEGPPIVKILSPFPNAAYLQGTPVNLMARIENAGENIERVEVRLNNNLLVEESAPNATGALTFSVSLSWPAGAPGQYTFTVTAFRHDGTTSEPASVMINVVDNNQSIPVSPLPTTTAPDQLDPSEQPVQTEEAAQPPQSAQPQQEAITLDQQPAQPAPQETIQPEQQTQDQNPDTLTGLTEQPSPNAQETPFFSREFVFDNAKFQYPESGWSIREGQRNIQLDGPNSTAAVISPQLLEQLSPGIGSDLIRAIQSIFNEVYSDEKLTFDLQAVSELFALADGRPARRYDFLDQFGDEAVIISVLFSDNSVGVIVAASQKGTLDDEETILQIASTFDVNSETIIENNTPETATVINTNPALQNPADPAQPTLPSQPEQATPPPQEPAPTNPTGRVVANAGANVRGGPGTNFPIINGLSPDTIVELIAVNPARDWYKIRYVRNEGWVAASLLDTEGDVDNLPVEPGS